MFQSYCCGGTKSGVAVVEMEKQDEESPEKDNGKGEETSYKLTSFNERIEAEPIRFLFHVAGVSFEDNRLDKDNWMEVKESMKWGKLPVLELGDIPIYSSTAIGRFLGRRFHLIGTGEIQSALCDEYVEICQDLLAAWKIFFEERDESKKVEVKNHLKATTFLDVLPKLNKSAEENTIKNGGSWIVGDACTWADLFLANLLEILEETVDRDFLAEYSALKKLKDAVFSIPEIVKYVENRPETNLESKSM